MSVFLDGGFWSSASAAFFGSLAAGAAGNNPYAKLAAGTISGGVGSVLAGGNFWQGAGIGLIVAALSNVTHQIDSPLDDGNGDPPTKRQKLQKTVDVTDQILNSNEAISALDEYIAGATKGTPSKILGKVGRISGNLSNITSVAVSGLEYSNVQISGLELTFDLGTTGTSIWVSSIVGAELGGPYGFAAGATIGAFSEFVVKPLYKNYIKPNVIVPAQKVYNRSWTGIYNQIIFNISRYH